MQRKNDPKLNYEFSRNLQSRNASENKENLEVKNGKDLKKLFNGFKRAMHFGWLNFFQITLTYILHFSYNFLKVTAFPLKSQRKCVAM